MSAETSVESPPDADDWHGQSAERVLAAFDSSETGLSDAEASRRLAAWGPNELTGDDGVSPLALFVSQFQDTLIYVLIVAAGLSLAVGFLPGQEPSYVDAGLILLILLANGVFGFAQDYRAEQSMARLRELSTPDATVVRNGVKRSVDATNVVPGDVVVLEQGDAVPADARLLDAQTLGAVESPLTGESATVTKTSDPIDDETPLAERRNMLYMNTNVVAGRGRAVVVATGMDTEVGSIATQMQAAEDGETPFQREVDALGRRIGTAVLALILLVVVVQVALTRTELISVVLTAVTLAVAAVPEGLPAVVTLTLALGAQRMADRNALVRRLPVVESLGSVDVILTDKTGTLTENRMTVTRVAAGGDVFDVSAPDGETGATFTRVNETASDGVADEASERPTALDTLLRCGAVCNDAEASPPDEDSDYFGDPTEVALLVAAERAGVDTGATRLAELPFSSERGRMTVVVDEAGTQTAYTKGAPGVVLERCSTELVDGEERPLTDERRAEIHETVDAFASDALRVLGFARKRPVAEGTGDELDEGVETALTFLGLQGMIDPPRPEVPGAVSDCRAAGVRVVMATGDNLETAKAVGRDIGFDTAGAMTGREVDACSDAELRERVEETEIFARAVPEHKVRVLRALQANGHVVAMTGDGVNDAPGVRGADVGVAMGQRGTDVTKSASDMVLRDDNFATIRDAIAAGRGIFDNIQTFVTLLLSANTAEVLTVFLGVLVGSLLFPQLFAAEAEALILTPAMLLWINLVTDGLPALALGVDPTADDVLERAPRGADSGVIDAPMVRSIGVIGVTVTLAGLLLFFDALQTTGSLVHAQTVLFTFFVVAEMGLVFVIRRRFGQSLGSNPWLIAAVAGSLALQLAVLYTPLAGLFEVVSLDAAAWTVIGLAVAAVVGVNLVASALFDRSAD